MNILEQLQHEAKSKDIQLLYVEDNNDIRFETATFLKKLFVNVDVCQNGAQGLEAYKTKHHDIIITDIKMPYLDGLEMSKEIKKLNRKAEIIVTTAFNEADLLLKAIEIGVGQYILKPIDMTIFAATLIKTIRFVKLEKRNSMLHEKMQNILNFQDNLLFTTDTNTITSCNRAFLKFFGYAKIKDLLDTGFEFCKYFIPDEGYCQVKSYKELCQIVGGYEGCVRIKLIEKATQLEKIFIAKIGSLAGFSEYIISLTDVSEFDKHYKELEMQSISDPLTKAYNRLKFISQLESEVERSKRYGVSLSLILFDVDNFKSINEIYGTQACDNALISISAIAQSEIRSSDIFGRVGDDEFAVLLPHTNFLSAYNAAEKIRIKVEDYDFNALGKITCSFGVSEFKIDQDIDTFFKEGGKMLQKAKSSGKNCVKTHEEYEEKLKNDILIKEEELLLKQLDLLKIKSEPIMVYTFFKGLAVSNSANIESVDFGAHSISLRLPKKKIAFIIRSNEAFLKHDSFAKAIHVKLLKSEIDKSFVVLNHLTQVNTAPIQRKTLRIVPGVDTTFKLTVKSKELSGKLLDLALNALSMEMNSIEGLLIGQDLHVFGVLRCENSNKDIRCLARVLKIIRNEHSNNFKVVLTLMPSKEQENIILDYISKRQIEIIREINSFVI